MELKPPANAATAPAQPDSQPAMAAPPPAHGQSQERRWRACDVLPLTIAIFFLVVSVVQTARGAHRDPRGLAFAVCAYYGIALLVCCVVKYEQLSPEPRHSKERARVAVAVWSVSTALTVAFAWRVAPVMPLALRLAVWGMAALTVAFGFYCLVLCNGGERGKPEPCQEDAAEKV